MTSLFSLTPTDILRDNKGLLIVRDFCATTKQTPFLTTVHEALVNAAQHGSRENDRVQLRLKETTAYFMGAVTQTKPVVAALPRERYRGWALIKAHSVRQKISADGKTLFFMVKKGCP